jgi:conjugative transfer signal peptidase TraF
MTAIGLFNKVCEAHFRTVRKTVFTSLVAAVAIFHLCGLVGLRINGSPSLPVGFYMTSSGPGAKLVEFCPAEPFASLALSRGYRDRGTCSDGGAPLLKPVVARVGDVVEVSVAGIAVNARLLRNTAPLRMDTKGRPLTSWSPGRYTVEPGFVWVASSYSRQSFDSRYFGPVAVRSIRDHIRPLLTVR